MARTHNDITETFVVMDADKNATTVAFTPSIFEEIAREFDGFRGCELIAGFDFDSDWDHWEVHPNGDEVGILLAGEVTFLLEKAGSTESVRLSRGGEFVIVPAGIWHTARTAAPTRMLFVTPGEGTRHG